MASFPDSLTGAFTPELLSRIASATDIEPGLIGRGLTSAGPVFTGAMAARAATPDGLQTLMRLIPADGGAGLGNVASLLTGSGGSALLNGVFGAGLGAVGRTLDQKLGFRASALLPVIGPTIMALLSKVRGERSLDDAGVASYLASEQRAFAASGGETAKVVEAALVSGAEADALRAAYTDHDWRTVRLAPMAAAQVVMLSDPSGPVGALKEATTVARVMAEGRPETPAASLLAVAWDEPLTMDDLRTLGGREATKESLLAAVRSAVALVSVKSPAEVAEYRRFLTTVAKQVAEASKEGGFLGIGGTRVSAEEHAALEELNVAMA